MNGLRRLALCVIAMLALSGCSNAGRNVDIGQTPTDVADTPQVAYKKITADEAKEIMDSGDDVILLDVRTREEYDEKHIPGAKLLPVDEINAKADSELPDKDALILIYCRTGRRSKDAAEALIGMGYANVMDFGGIVDWPYDTE